MQQPFFLTLILIIAMPLMSSADEIAVGAKAPAMTVTTDTGESLNLASVYAKGPTLIFFYPKAGTPGCTAQACNLRDNFSVLEGLGMQVLGVSADNVESQAKFRGKHELPFPLVADTEKELVKAFGVPAMLFVKRQSFLVVDGKIAWRDLSANPSSQTEDAVQALKSLAKSGS